MHMKNFLRALRHAGPYYQRFVLSILCAILAAILWGLNFTSIYPVLRLLNTGSSLHKVVKDAIESTKGEVDQIEKRIKEMNDEEDSTQNQKAKLDPATYEKRMRDISNDLLKQNLKLSSARSSLYWYQVLLNYITKFLPDDCFQTLAYVIGLVVIGVAVKCAFEFGQESLVGSVVNLSLFDLKNRFYRRVIHLDVDQFSDTGTSELMSRFTNDMDSLGTGIKTLCGKVIAEPLRALACVVMACFISWQLTLLFLILVPIAGLILVRVGRIMRQASRRLLERMSSIYKILQESFQGIRLVKVSTTEPQERRRFNAATRDYYRKSMQVVNLDALTDPVIELLGVAAVAFALLAGSYLVLQRETHIFGLRLLSQPLEPESLLQLYILLAAIADPVRKFSSVFTRLQSACAAADRIFDYLDRNPRVTANSDGPRLARPAWLPRSVPKEPLRESILPPAKPYIEFRDVCYSYHPGGPPVLSHINLTVNAGETIALVGPNGCGKTTLVSMIPRFQDPDHGSILIDGIDLRRVQLRSLRQLIGLVSQKTFLFDDTIYKNIAYGVHGATREMVEEAAQRAFAHDFILSRPRGYDDRVGEAGTLVSGGQGQRLALARVILRNPAILILDEFTSQNDPESEAAIHQALRDFKRGRTTFVITHRLNTLEIADRIIVMDEGRITAMGTHRELLASSPTYQRLHEAQGQRRVA
jgi:ATP-binding cassette, subfamily B, bacterial MsbA